MAYPVGYFGCACLKDWEFFQLAINVINRMRAWNEQTHQATCVNASGYRSMFKVSIATLYHNIHCYFDMDDFSFGANFATHPFELSGSWLFNVNASYPLLSGSSCWPNLLPII